MFKVYLSLGSNIEPEIHIPLALKRLKDTLTVSAHSAAYRSPPAGSDGPGFLNAVALIQTDLNPETLKRDFLRPLEAELGRIRTEDKNAPRPIDIDILLHNDNLYEEDLWKQAYLAVPLAEIYPEYKNPHTGQTIQEIASALTPRQKITRQDNIL